MADDEISEKGFFERAVQARVPHEVGFFLDTLVRISAYGKRAVVHQIFSAGLKEVTGKTYEEIIECGTHRIRPGTEIDRRDLRAITKLLCGNTNDKG